MAVEEHEPVDLEEALKIADRYLARGGEMFEYEEDASSATTFGFSRSKDTFIEIDINCLTEISYKFEISDPNASWFRKMFGGVFRYEKICIRGRSFLKRLKNISQRRLR